MECRLDAFIEKAQEGDDARCPALEGCQSQGATFEEVCRNIQEAAERYWETLASEEKVALHP